MTDKFDPYYTWLGIPPDEQPADYYRLLGLRRFEENPDVIANAADARMGFVRGFQTGAKSAISQQLLNELSAAKLCLLDSRKRAQYDSQLRSRDANLGGSALLPVDVVPPMPALGAAVYPPAAGGSMPPWASTGLTAPAAPIPSPSSYVATSPSTLFESPNANGGALLTADPIRPVTLRVRRTLHHPPTHSLSYPTLFVVGLAVLTIAGAVVYRFHFGGGTRLVRVGDMASGATAGTTGSTSVANPTTSESRRSTVSARSRRSGDLIRARSKYESRSATRATRESVNVADGAIDNNSGALNPGALNPGAENPDLVKSSDDLTRPAPRTGLADLVTKPADVTGVGDPTGPTSPPTLLPPTAQSSTALPPTVPATPAAGLATPGKGTTTGSDDSVESGVAPPEPPHPSPSGKRPVPSDAERATKLALIQQIYKLEFANAKRADGKSALAQQLLKKGQTTANDPVGQFVLWEQARDLAADAGQLGDALAAIDELAATFDVAAWKMRIAAVERVQTVLASSSQAPATLRAKMIEDGLRAAETAVSEEHYDEAERIVTVVEQQTHSRAIVDAELRRAAKERGEAVLSVCRLWRDVQRSLGRLSADPNDAAANLVVGGFRCFQRDEWSTGLPLLAKSDQPKLAEAARLDLAVVEGDAAGQLQVALAWERAAEGMSIEARREYLSRAVHWFQASIKSGLTGLDQELATKRLESLRTIVPDPHPTDSVALSTGSIVTVHPGMIGRVFSGVQELDVLVTYQPGKPISPAVVQRIQRDTKSTAPLRFDLAGIVAIDNGSRLAAMHEGGGATAIHRLVIGNNRGSQIDAARPSDRPNLTAATGRLPVAWQLNGLDGKVRTQLTLTDTRTQQSPKIYYTKQMLSVLRPTVSTKKGEYRKEYRLEGP